MIGSFHSVSRPQVGLNRLVSEELEGLDKALPGRFSAGQRQLFCLSQALLRRNKVLVLDEATANVDPSAELIVQQIIREKFANCTVLTIAHRLHTVMGCDKILVIDDGVVAEFDSPQRLMRIPNGAFKRMTDHYLEDEP